MAGDRLMVLIDQLIILLHEPHKNISRLCQSELLPKTNSWTAIEGEKFPSGLPANPAFRLELIGIRTPQISATVHDVHQVVDFLALLDVDWRLTVGTTATGKGGVFGSTAAIQRDVGVQPQDLG